MTYLLGDPVSKDAVVIDPLRCQATLLQALLAEQGLRLKYVLRTHVHRPDTIDCGDLCAQSGARYVIGAANAGDLPGERVREGDQLRFGQELLSVIETPGHTPGCVTYLWCDRIFCGDLLEIGGCAPTVEETNAGALYDSVRNRIFVLRGETLVFPGHDHAMRTVSTVAEERMTNTAFSGLSRDAFIQHIQQRERCPDGGRVLPPKTRRSR